MGVEAEGATAARVRPTGLGDLTKFALLGMDGGASITEPGTVWMGDRSVPGGQALGWKSRFGGWLDSGGC